jgi:hypothetical protein
LFDGDKRYFLRVIPFLLLFLVLTGVFAVSLFRVYATASDTVTWKGGTGVWENPTNWSSGSVPTPTDDVQINYGAVTISSTQSVGSISIAFASTLNCESCILDTPTGDIVNSGTIVNNRGNITVETGDLNNTTSGVIDNGPVGVISVATGDVNNSGVIMNGSGSTMTVDVGSVTNTGTIDNCSGGKISISGYTSGTPIAQAGTCLLGTTSSPFV